MPLTLSQLRVTAVLTSIAGLAALGVTVAFRMLPEVRAAADCMPADAVIRFEFARTPADLASIFGACPAKAVAAVDAVNHLDVAAYIPSYNAFAALAAVFLARAVRRPLVLAAIAAAVVTLVADYVETINLLRISKDLDGTAALLPIASTAAWTKFGFLGLNAAILSAIAFTARPRRPILGSLLLLPPIATALMALDPSRSALLNYAYLLSWTPVLAVALRTAATGKV